MSAVFARVLAIVAAALCVGGFLLTANMEARASELRQPPLSFWGQLPTLAFLAVPYLLGFASAVAAARSVVPALVVLVGCTINAWIVYAAWRHHVRWSLVELAVGMLQTWACQFLVCSIAVAGGVEGIKQARRQRAETTGPSSAGTP